LSFITTDLKADSCQSKLKQAVKSMKNHQRRCKAPFRTFDQDKYFLTAAFLITVAIGNPERHVRKASHRGSKQQ